MREYIVDQGIGAWCLMPLLAFLGMARPRIAYYTYRTQTFIRLFSSKRNNKYMDTVRKCHRKRYDAGQAMHSGAEFRNTVYFKPKQRSK